MSYRSVEFDSLLTKVEHFQKTNFKEIENRILEVTSKIDAVILSELPTTKSKSGQFQLLRKAINRGTLIFQDTASKMSKESLMSIARRAPSSYLKGADLILAKLIIKYANPNPATSFSVGSTRNHDLAVSFTEDDLYEIFKLMAVATAIFRLERIARLVGKGGVLKVIDQGYKVNATDDLNLAVSAYERRRPNNRFLDSQGFFTPQPKSQIWSGYRIPFIEYLGGNYYFESPLGSDFWLTFERWPSRIDGASIYSVLRGYDEPLKELHGIDSTHVLHFLTSLSALVDYSLPKPLRSDHKLAFEAEDSEAFMHKLQFAFGLSRKGFLRLPKEDVIDRLSMVVTEIASDEVVRRKLITEFIEAFSSEIKKDEIDVSLVTGAPFIHDSTEDHLYIDLLLIPDFIAGILEQCKSWYESQHGDRFTLDLKRWINLELSDAVVDSRVKVRLENGSKSDIDILIKWRHSVLAIECKAYAKSRDYMIGSPEAVRRRRNRIKKALAQIERTTEAFKSNSGMKNVIPVVCTPSPEFLMPLNEFGFITKMIPRVLTPEELLELLKSV